MSIYSFLIKLWNSYEKRRDINNMSVKNNDGDIAILLGAGASVEAGVSLPERWSSLTNASTLIVELQSYLKAAKLSLNPFEIGDPNDGEKLVRGISIAASKEVAPKMRRYKSALKIVPEEFAVNEFQKLATLLKDLLSLPPNADLKYLNDLLKFAVDHRKRGFSNIFTLNYDTTVELAAEEMGYTCVSMPGLYSIKARCSRDLAIRGISLLKINGSVDWSFHRRDTPTGERKDLLRGEHNWSPDVESVCFLDLTYTPWAADLASFQLKQFEKRLKDNSFLLAIGYSFRRADINEILIKWCSLSRAQKITIFDPNPSKYHENFQKACAGLARCEIRQMTAGEAVKSFNR